MIKKDFIVAGIICGIYITEIILKGRAGAIIGLLNFLCGAFAVWYFLMRKGVLG